jgi:hypothetical protein
MSRLFKRISVILLLITGAGEITISSGDAIQYTTESFGLDELDEKIEKNEAQ